MMARFDQAAVLVAPSTWASAALVFSMSHQFLGSRQLGFGNGEVPTAQKTLEESRRERWLAKRRFQRKGMDERRVLGMRWDLTLVFLP